MFAKKLNQELLHCSQMPSALQSYWVTQILYLASYFPDALMGSQSNQHLLQMEHWEVREDKASENVHPT